MEVRAGLDPENQDEDVRFRTTYYFRTFDYCFGRGTLDRQQAVLILPETDSLYRFRMTGKAHSLTTKVRFESGFLQSWQIDPFGANVVFDDKLKRHRFQSQQEAKQELARETALADFKQLLVFHRDLGDENGLQATKARLDQALSTKLAEFVGSGPDSTGAAGSTVVVRAEELDAAKKTLVSEAKRELAAGRGAKSVSTPIFVSAGDYKQLVIVEQQLDKDGKLTGEPAIKALEAKWAVRDKDGSSEGLEYRPSSSTALQCPEGASVQRGFQILGPEGWRTFDQEERLIMAMTTSAQPLVDTLKEYSDRILNAKASSADVLLPLVREDLRISRAQRLLDRLEQKPPDFNVVFEKVILRLSNGAQ